MVSSRGKIHSGEIQASRSYSRRACARVASPEADSRMQRPQFVRCFEPKGPTPRSAADLKQRVRKTSTKELSAQHRRERTNICDAIEPEGAKAIKEDAEWEAMKLAADSGAMDTVIPPSE